MAGRSSNCFGSHVAGSVFAVGSGSSQVVELLPFCAGAILSFVLRRTILVSSKSLRLTHICPFIR